MPRRARRPAGTGTISRRAQDGLYVVAVSLGRDPATGRRLRRVAYARTEPEARRMLQTLLRAVHRDALPVARPPTLAEYAHRWLRDYVLPTRRPRTVDLYATHLRARLLPRLGAYRLDQLTPALLQRTYAAWLADGLAPSTVHTVHAILRACLRQAMREGLLARLPTEGAQLPPARIGRARPRLSLAELARLEAACARPDVATRWPWLGVAVGLLAWAGLRLGELRGLRWEAIDWAASVVHVREQASLRADGTSAPLKALGSARTVPLVPALQRRLRAWQLAAPSGAWVLTNPATGAPYSVAGILRPLRRLGALCGLPDLRPHLLRHTYASLLHDAGVPVAVASRLLGHTRASLTLDVYTHPPTDAVAEAARRLAGLAAAADGDSVVTGRRWQPRA